MPKVYQVSTDTYSDGYLYSNLKKAYERYKFIKLSNRKSYSHIASVIKSDGFFTEACEVATMDLQVKLGSVTIRMRTIQ